jgi:flagellar assembly protein FliH
LPSETQERGVAAMAGFEAGAAYTPGVSVLEFRSLEDESAGEAGETNEPAGAGAREAELAAAVAAQCVAARLEGFQQGEREGWRKAHAEMDAEMQSTLARERGRVVGAVQEFRAAREEYFGGVEQEVVKLALAIAARVLHRETQLDPLLLEGAVHVALERMADRTSVVLRTAMADVAVWERVLSTMDADERPAVRGDAGLERGECVLETKMGTVELGVKAQLQEIERGFFDLLSRRPDQLRPEQMSTRLAS